MMSSWNFLAVHSGLLVLTLNWRGDLDLAILIFIFNQSRTSGLRDSLFPENNIFCLWGPDPCVPRVGQGWRARNIRCHSNLLERLDGPQIYCRLLPGRELHHSVPLPCSAHIQGRSTDLFSEFVLACGPTISSLVLSLPKLMRSRPPTLTHGKWAWACSAPGAWNRGRHALGARPGHCSCVEKKMLDSVLGPK